MPLSQPTMHAALLAYEYLEGHPDAWANLHLGILLRQVLPAWGTETVREVREALGFPPDRMSSLWAWSRGKSCDDVMDLLWDIAHGMDVRGQ